VATVYNSLPNFPLQKLSETTKSQVSGWLLRSNKVIRVKNVYENDYPFWSRQKGTQLVRSQGI